MRLKWQLLGYELKIKTVNFFTGYNLRIFLVR